MGLCVEHRQHKGLNNRTENSHQPTRRRELIMKRFNRPGRHNDFCRFTIKSRPLPHPLSQIRPTDFRRRRVSEPLRLGARSPRRAPLPDPTSQKNRLSSARRSLKLTMPMRHQCIRARMGTGKLYRWEFEKRGQAVLIDAPGSLTLDESGLMLEAALAGAGLAYLGEPSAAEHIAAGRLEVVLADWTPPYPGLSPYFAGRRHIPARLRARIDLIREQGHTIG